MRTITTPVQAIQIAVEMEKRAIRTYQQGITLMEGRDGDVLRRLTDIIQDEWGHLQQFNALRRQELEKEGRELTRQEIALAKSKAAEVLFPGGVLDLIRSGSLHGDITFLQFALKNELDAMGFYHSAADSLEEGCGDVFEKIAQEEQSHAQRLYKDISLLAMKNGEQ